VPPALLKSRTLGCNFVSLALPVIMLAEVLARIYRVSQKMWIILKVYITPVCDEAERHSIYENVHSLSRVRLVF